MKPFMFAAALLFLPALAQADCGVCPSSKCQMNLEGGFGVTCAVGTCTNSPPLCDSINPPPPPPPPPGGQTSSVIVSIAVASSPVFTLTMSPNPAGPISCSAAPGTVVSKATTTGGNGKAAVLSLSGDVLSFALSGQNLVVGNSGIAAADCGKTDLVTVTAVQPP
jgi:hypothetical protein